jgi:flagellar biosynthetic protein FliQ
MDADQAVDIARRAIALTLVVGAPLLLTVLIVGLIVSILQAATQVQDQTLSFVPKLLAVAIAAAITAPWLIGRLIEFGIEMFGPP